MVVRSRRLKPFMASGKLEVDGLYWVTMLTAGTLGTTLGEGSADQLSLIVSTAVWLGIWTACLFAMRQLKLTSAVAYWGMVYIIRTIGTNLGDWFAGRHGLQLGLPIATGFSAISFVGLLALWPSGPLASAGVQGIAD